MNVVETRTTFALQFRMSTRKPQLKGRHQRRSPNYDTCTLAKFRATHFKSAYARHFLFSRSRASSRLILCIHDRLTNARFDSSYHLRRSSFPLCFLLHLFIYRVYYLLYRTSTTYSRINLATKAAETRYRRVQRDITP